MTETDALNAEAILTEADEQLRQRKLLGRCRVCREFGQVAIAVIDGGAARGWSTEYIEQVIRRHFPDYGRCRDAIIAHLKRHQDS